MPVYFWGSMAADHLGASLSRLDRFISSASRADDRNKELTVVPSGRGQLAQVLSVQRYMKLNGREELQ
jgi:hypothetical protein